MRRRILLLVVGMTTLVVLAFAIPLVVLIRNNAYNDGVTSLRSEASDIARYLRGENATRTTTQITSYLNRLRDDRDASVQLPSGEVLGSVPPGGVTALPALPPQGRFGTGPDATASTPPDTGGDAGGQGGAPGGGGPGAFQRDLEPQTYAGGKIVQLRVPTFDFGLGAGLAPSGSGAYTVRVYGSDGSLRSGDGGSLLLLFGVAVGLLLLGVLAGEVLTRRIVRPLVQTATTAQALSAGDTTARAPTDGPGEVADVGRALNRLADRIDELIAEERETVADLSHRLRTPLTALRLDAEALDSPADAERIGMHVSTLERMLTAVIRLARRPQREGRIPSCDATAVVADRVAFWSALTEEQGRTATVSLPDRPLPVRAAEEDLAAAVDALLENVVAHTPEGTSFTVRLAGTPSGARLEVADDGPGLGLEEPVRGRSDRGSTGLGLDIARRCAQASGGSLTLGASPSGGALVTVELGRP